MGIEDPIVDGTRDAKSTSAALKRHHQGSKRAVRQTFWIAAFSLLLREIEVQEFSLHLDHPLHITFEAHCGQSTHDEELHPQ